MVSKKSVLILAFLVVIGGVIAITWTGGDTAPDANETPTGEPYGMNGSGYTTGDLPRGVTVDGVVASPLIEEHESKLAKSTFTLTTIQTKEVRNDTRKVRTVYKKGENAVHISKSAEGELLREEYYNLENGTKFLCDHTTTADCPTSVSSTQNGSEYKLTETKAVFLSGRWAPTDVNENAAYTEVGLQTKALKNATPLSNAFYISNVTDFSGRATVDERQVITKLNISVTGDMNGQIVDFRHEASVDAVNRTRVSKPRWVREAEAQTRTAGYGMSSDNRTLYITNTKETTYDAGTTVKVSIDKGQTYETVELTLEEGLDADDTLYLTFVDGQLRAYQNEAPDQRGDALTDDSYVVRLISSDGTPETLTVEIVP